MVEAITVILINL